MCFPSCLPRRLFVSCCSWKWQHCSSIRSCSFRMSPIDATWTTAHHRQLAHSRSCWCYFIYFAVGASNASLQSFFRLLIITVLIIIATSYKITAKRHHHLEKVRTSPAAAWFRAFLFSITILLSHRSLLLSCKNAAFLHISYLLCISFCSTFIVSLNFSSLLFCFTSCPLPS